MATDLTMATDGVLKTIVFEGTDSSGRWRRYGLAVTRPLVRLWESDRPLDAYALVQFAGAAGDALVAIALVSEFARAVAPTGRA